MLSLNTEKILSYKIAIFGVFMWKKNDWCLMVGPHHKSLKKNLVKQVIKYSVSSEIFKWVGQTEKWTINMKTTMNPGKWTKKE